MDVILFIFLLAVGSGLFLLAGLRLSEIDLTHRQQPRKNAEKLAKYDLERRKRIEADTSFETILKLYGLDQKDSIREIIKILTEDHLIAGFSHSNLRETESGWFGLYDKVNYCPMYIFSDRCAATIGDRGEYDDICSFNTLEHNMAGLADFLLH